MSCSHPLLAVYKGKDESGKKQVQILTRIDEFQTIEEAIERYQTFGHRLMLLPCGKCPGCLKTRRKQWAVRCEAEAKLYADNCFVTLTYDDVNLPLQPVKEHYQKFLRSIRKAGYKVRYFGCCERGSKTNRIHFHIILFGYIPDDLKASHKSDAGFWCYTSKFLSSIWKKGLVVVNDFTPECAAYVAGYVDKKLTHVDDDSFIFMSTRPGIGRIFIESNLGKIYSYDNIITSFGSHKLGLPRYFDKVAEQNGLVLDNIRAKRVQASEINRAEKFRQLGVQDFRGYFDRVLDTEIEALKRRKRGL